MTLGERIYRLRTEKEMSQGDLADALEVSRQSISKWETNGSVPELDKLVRLSEIFGISLDELVTGKETEQQEKQLIFALVNSLCELNGVKKVQLVENQLKLLGALKQK